MYKTYLFSFDHFQNSGLMPVQCPIWKHKYKWSVIAGGLSAHIWQTANILEIYKEVTDF